MAGRPFKKVEDMRGHIPPKEKADRLDDEAAMYKYTPLIEQPPAWLDDYGVTEWDRVVPLLKSDIPVSELDAATIAAHCQAYADMQHAAEIINTSGMVNEDGKANPAVKQLRDATAQMLTIDNSLGLNVYSRLKLQVQHNIKKPDDPFAKLVGKQ